MRPSAPGPAARRPEGHQRGWSRRSPFHEVGDRGHDDRPDEAAQVAAERHLAQVLADPGDIQHQPQPAQGRRAPRLQRQDQIGRQHADPCVGGAVGRRDPAQVHLNLVRSFPGGEGAAKVEQEPQRAQLPPARPGQRTARRRRRLGHLICPHSVPCQRAGGGGSGPRSCASRFLHLAHTPDGRVTAGNGRRGLPYAR
jgi:hypothetical protein